MLETLTAPVPVWQVLLLLAYLHWFRWRPNDRARGIIAERLAELERRVDGW
ncbi:MAG: hypothetical protein AAF526_01790 [Pseudomonadota bacterium]